MRKYSFTLIVAALAVASCTKTGPQGPAGQNGTNGANGANGNANVSAFTVTASSWTGGSNGLYYVDATIDSLTPAVVISGAVSVFMETNTSPVVWTSLPFTDYRPAQPIEYFFSYTSGVIEIDAQNTKLSTITFSGAANFKVVIIPAGN